MPSNYCRQTTVDKLFLETIIESKKQLQGLCDVYCNSNNVPKFSNKVLLRQMVLLNLDIYKHRKDQCNVYVSFSCGNINEEEYKANIRRKEEALIEKEAEKTKAA